MYAPATVSLSEDGKIVTIFGIRYDMELFRHLAVGPIGSRVEIIGRDDGVVSLKHLEAHADAAGAVAVGEAMCSLGTTTHNLMSKRPGGCPGCSRSN